MVVILTPIILSMVVGISGIDLIFSMSNILHPRSCFFHRIRGEIPLKNAGDLEGSDPIRFRNLFGLGLATFRPARLAG